MKITEMYTNGWKLLIKPVQMEYSEDILGPTIRKHKNLKVIRVDFGTRNQKGKVIQGTYYYVESLKDQIPTVVYCHSHNGNRCQGEPLLHYLIPKYNLCIFDFSSFGKSEGEYCTMGAKEQDDLSEILDILRDSFSVKDFIIWGRSMGASVGLLYADKYAGEHNIRAMVLDQPYGNLKEMVSDIF